jgi:GTP cyclohydrolase FolE2
MGCLKRPDEKYVTEKAYENPKFVEDLVRDVAHGSTWTTVSATTSQKPKILNRFTTTRLTR